MAPEVPDISKTKARLRAKGAYLHLTFAFLPTPPDAQTFGFVSDLETWLTTTGDTDVANRAAELDAALDNMIALAQKRLPPRKHWQEIATDYLEGLASGSFSFSIGIPYGWLAERFEPASLGGPPDIPYHARVGLGPHSGRASIEEDFLLRDAYFMLAKSSRALIYLESFLGKPVEAEADKQYRSISVANQNVATYSRFSVSGFYAFVECFVNSVGEDFLRRNPTLNDSAKELLRGKRDNRYLSVEKKIELFPSLIRPDGKRPLVLSDNKQITEPYLSFTTHIKEVRDAAAHYAKSKADILMSPQMWNKKAKEAATVCMAVARGFWTACYPDRSPPLYLGKLDEALHLKIAESRIDSEFGSKC